MITRKTVKSIQAQATFDLDRAVSDSVWYYQAGAKKHASMEYGKALGLMNYTDCTFLNLIGKVKYECKTREVDYMEYANYITREDEPKCQENL